MNRLGGKAALVTGAGGVIGRGICLTLAAAGGRVACVDIDAARCEETVGLIRAEGGDAIAIQADLSERDEARRSVRLADERFGRLDILVNNAMWIRYQPIEEVDEAGLEKMFGVGLKAAIWMTQAAVPALRRQGGSIINVSSIAAIRGSPNRILYCTIKGGIDAMTMQCAVELGPLGVRVNGIAPGMVPHPGSSARLGPDLIKLRLETTPLGRLATAEDMASVVLFLASDDSRFVTGTVIPVDGGRRIVS